MLDFSPLKFLLSFNVKIFPQILALTKKKFLFFQGFEICSPPSGGEGGRGNLKPSFSKALHSSKFLASLYGWDKIKRKLLNTKRVFFDVFYNFCLKHFSLKEELSEV
jgi:hypothetical protein